MVQVQPQQKQVVRVSFCVTFAHVDSADESRGGSFRESSASPSDLPPINHYCMLKQKQLRLKPKASWMSTKEAVHVVHLMEFIMEGAIYQHLKLTGEPSATLVIKKLGSLQHLAETFQMRVEMFLKSAEHCPPLLDRVFSKQ